jgi:hypothetical protein
MYSTTAGGRPPLGIRSIYTFRKVRTIGGCLEGLLLAGIAVSADLSTSRRVLDCHHHLPRRLAATALTMFCEKTTVHEPYCSRTGPGRTAALCPTAAQRLPCLRASKGAQMFFATGPERDPTSAGAWACCCVIFTAAWQGTGLTEAGWMAEVQAS